MFLPRTVLCFFLPAILLGQSAAAPAEVPSEEAIMAFYNKALHGAATLDPEHFAEISDEGLRLFRASRNDSKTDFLLARQLTEFIPMNMERGASKEHVAAWLAHFRAAVRRQWAEPSLDQRSREVLFQLEAGNAYYDAFQGSKTPEALAVLGEKLDAAAAHAPQGQALPNYENAYIAALAKSDAAAAERRLRVLIKSPNQAIASMATGRLLVDRMKSTPLELRFTAVDGQEVDFARLRGKVVLIDFWATWCGPCIRELPNVKDVYTRYHDKGFEVVSIALENADFKPDDTPDKHAEKFAKAKAKLMEFTAKENMPWAQYMDGRYWKTDLSVRYNVMGIPAMFLLDQEGRLVTTNARGEKLEQEVKRLLKL